MDPHCGNNGAEEVAVTSFYYDIFHTPMGWMGVLASLRGVRRCTLRFTPDQAMAELGPEVERAQHDEGFLAAAREKLLAYLGGEGVSLDDVPLDMEGASAFFKAAWEACRRIPVGETRSYAWLAWEAGRPRAFRAAGQAMARNRFSLLVPCHRVIASDGGLHGYGGGLDLKARLLEMERAAKAPRPASPSG